MDSRCFLLACILAAMAVPSSSAENVTLSLYYETLCPYCADFIVNHLPKVFENGLISFLNLRLIPWGNALVQPDGTFLCQHGQNECVLNSMDACTIAVYPDPIRHFAFVRCIEILVLENKLNEWIGCFRASGLSDAPIIDCYTNGLGKELERQHAAETGQLNPQHRFVPWVVVDGQPLQEDFSNFQHYICQVYRQRSNDQLLPEACNSLSMSNYSFNDDEDLVNEHRVCYVRGRR
ncbi:Gamma-interferon-responsive lysosomal thiol protein [Linum grandiflorum]